MKTFWVVFFLTCAFGVFAFGVLSYMDGPIGNWYCRKMRWHRKPYTPINFDGASEHARCERCGFIGMIDSQGNLF